MMRSQGWILISKLVLSLLICPMLVCTFSSTAVVAQTEKGTADLEEAFQKKIDAKSTKDLDKVVKLCESAIKKGLDEGGMEQANQLAAAALVEHAEQLSERIFTGRQDPRWRVYRTHALSRLDKAVKFKPDMGDAYLMIAKLNSLPGGDSEAAKAAVEKAVEMAGDDREQLSNALFYRASLADDEEGRLADLNQAIKINPKNMDAVRVRAFYYLSKDDADSALEDLNSWLDSDEKNASNYIIVARQLMATGSKFDERLQKEAIRVLDKAIELDGKNILPLMMRAEVHSVGDNLEAAADDATSALEINKRSYSALLLRASIYSDQRKLDEALADVNRALNLEPGRVDGLQMRGVILSQQENFSEAIDDVRALANSFKDNPTYQQQLAMLYNADDQPTQAIRIYDRLLKDMDPDSWEGKSAGRQMNGMFRRAATLRGAGDAYLSLGQHQKAVTAYDEALELGEGVRELQENEGQEETNKPDDGVLNNLAWVLSTSPDDKVRDGERAIKLATQAAELTEFKEAHVLSTLASGYAESGDFENAIKWIKKAIEVNQETAKEAVDKARTDKQFKSLNKEWDNYKEKKPWREMQNVEEEKKKKAKEDADEEEEADSEKSDDDDEKEKSDDDDEDEGDEKEKDDDEDDKDDSN